MLDRIRSSQFGCRVVRSHDRVRSDLLSCTDKVGWILVVKYVKLNLTQQQLYVN